MSVESDWSTGVDVVPGACKNAKDYALKRLEQVEEPLRPAQIASEYGCTPGHMRDALAELRETGDVDRVDHGEYTLSPGTTTGGVDRGFGVESADAGPVKARGEEPENPRPSVGGSAPSQDVDGAEGTDESVGEERSIGVPLPVSSTTLMVGVVVLFLVVVVWSHTRADGSNDGQVQQQEETEDGSVDPFTEDTGMIE